MKGRMKSALFSLTLILAFILAWAAPPATNAGERNMIGTYGDWTAFAEGPKSKKVCFMAGAPVKEEGKYASRGDTFMTITHRQAEKSRNVVSVRAGYTYQKDSEVTVTIGDETFALFTEEGYAWARDAKTDTDLAMAMRAGAKMIVKGVSGRGTKTTDTYSLKGFTAAHKAIGKACGVK